MNLILASRSPRRSELLTAAGIAFEVLAGMGFVATALPVLLMIFGWVYWADRSRSQNRRSSGEVPAAAE